MCMTWCPYQQKVFDKSLNPSSQCDAEQLLEVAAQHKPVKLMQHTFWQDSLEAADCACTYLAEA